MTLREIINFYEYIPKIPTSYRGYMGISIANSIRERYPDIQLRKKEEKSRKKKYMSIDYDIDLVPIVAIFIQEYMQKKPLHKKKRVRLSTKIEYVKATPDSFSSTKKDWAFDDEAGHIPKSLYDKEAVKKEMEADDAGTRRYFNDPIGKY